jgi:hypothetical protein
VTFQLPAGVGARKNVSVAVVDAGGDASLTQVSNTASFSYFPPTITGFNPTPVFAQWTRRCGGVALSRDNSLYDAYVADIRRPRQRLRRRLALGPTKQNWSPVESQLDRERRGLPVPDPGHAATASARPHRAASTAARTTPPATPCEPEPALLDHRHVPDRLPPGARRRAERDDPHRGPGGLPRLVAAARA